MLTARLDPDTFAPGDRVAHAGLRTGRRDHDRFAKGASRGNERLETGRVDAVVVGDKELHWPNAKPIDELERTETIAKAR